jgi:hypothetical protein
MAVTAEDLAAVVRERFFEVYNGHPAVAHLGDEIHPSVERLWDLANTIRLAQLGAPPLFGVAVDDSHDYHGESDSGEAGPGRGWIMVRAAELDAETLIRAIKAGQFYASSGVTLRDVSYQPKMRHLSVEIDPEIGATYVTQFIGTKREYDSTSEPRFDKDGKPIRTTRKYSAEVGQILATVEGTSPAYQLTGDELYVRAVVTSNKPHPDPSFTGQMKQAWTQPVGWE